MQTLSLVWGVLAFLGMVVGFLPCLGSLNWLNIPFAAVGLILSVIAMISAKGTNNSPSVAGVVCCAVAIAIGLVRLALGGGVL